jgi:uncharacterized protein with HEPN domain
MSVRRRQPTQSMSSDAVALRRWLDDIKYHITLARKFAEGMTYDAFCGDPRTVYAVTRCVEIISEASRRLPDELKARHSAIQWRDMAGAGNVYRHQYEDVGAREVWDSDRARTSGLGWRVIAGQCVCYDNPMDKSIRRYTDFEEMKADEYRLLAKPPRP